MAPTLPQTPGARPAGLRSPRFRSSVSASGDEGGRAMFASVRRYRLESGSIDDLLHLVDTDFAESVQEMDGFVEYQVLECGNGEIVTITTFRDRRSAEESMDM